MTTKTQQLNAVRRALEGTKVRLVHGQRARKLRKQAKTRNLEVSKRIVDGNISYYVWMPISE